MENKTHKALEMIASGYSVETVMDILGLEPEELRDILEDMIGQPIDVTWATQFFASESIGEFEVNVN
tara:strand:+ start:771 stop:971 length:201 start_codon:yes stop_codon:yes gene_type:complete